MKTIKGKKRSHEWGVIAQCKEPYREFWYCGLCKKYKEVGSKNKYIKRTDIPKDASEPDVNYSIPYW